MIVVRVLVLAILVRDVILLKIKPEAIMRFEAICKSLLTFAYFEDNKVIGRYWTIYFIWNSYSVESNCMDISFKKADGAIISRFQRAMQQHLKTKPVWANATLLMTLNVTHDSHEILLFPDPLAEVGRFFGVPKLIKTDDGPHMVDMMSFNFVLKLTRRGRYLLLSDCQTGVTFFLVRRGQKHTWKEIDAAIKVFDYNGDPGYPACKYSLRKKRRPDKS